MSVPIDVLLLGARRASHVLPVIPPLMVLTWALMSWTKLDAGLDLLRTSRSAVAAARLRPRVDRIRCRCPRPTGRGTAGTAVAVTARRPDGGRPRQPLHTGQHRWRHREHELPAAARLDPQPGVVRNRVNSAATVVTHVAILVAVVVLAPHTLAPIPLHVAPIAIGAGVLVAAGAIAVIVWRRGMRDGSGESRWRHTVAELRIVCRHPTRAVQLWGAALTAPLMHGAILVCIAPAIGLHVGVIAIVVTYFAASGLASLAPSFGGMGALDLTLGVALARMSGDRRGCRRCRPRLPLGHHMDSAPSPQQSRWHC